MSENMAYAAHVAGFPVCRQQPFDIRARQVGVGDDGVGKAVVVGDGLAPAGFSERIVGVPVGLDVYRLDHAMGRAVGDEVFDEIAPAHGRVVAVHARRVGSA